MDVSAVLTEATVLDAVYISGRRAADRLAIDDNGEN